MGRHTINELDIAIDRMIGNPGSAPPVADGDLREILDAAAELRVLASADFRARLKADLLNRALQGPAAVRHSYRQARPVSTVSSVLPTLFSVGPGTYPLRNMNIAASVCLHSAALLLIVLSGLWIGQKTQGHRTQVISLINPDSYVLPSAASKAGGGGGGGDRDRLKASKGTPPHSAQEQIAPPAVIVRNSAPKLPVEPTVVAPPQIVLPHAQLGDPLSAVLSPPSNGTGSGGGIGSGGGGGVGSGTGPGIGAGTGGGVGGGIYRIGGGVGAPRVLYAPDPEYSDEARKAKYQGTVVLWVIVGSDGLPREVRVARSLGMGLDEKAVQAVRTWRFAPAMKDGRPVAVHMNVEVTFRLY